MSSVIEQIRSFLRENPRAWTVVAAAFLIALIVIWGVWGGFQLEFSRFFAADSVDPSGACVWRVQFNAPEGAWFCPNLQCQLDGNPVNGENFPPQGPAVKLVVKIHNQFPVDVDPAMGPINIRTVLDATPKCANNKECYPPKDPLWTCTAAPGVMYQGRNGHDFYDCYIPIIQRTNYGPIECCANTGLPGDCFTWNYNDSTGTPPVSTPTPVPLPAPVQLGVTCSGRGNILTWTTPLPIGSTQSILTKTTIPTSGASSSADIVINASSNPSSYGDRDIISGYSYAYAFKNHPDVRSNIVSCGSVSPVTCEPSTQNVEANQPARIFARGGNGAYTWSVSRGGKQVGGGVDYIEAAFSSGGNKSVSVTSEGLVATCMVAVAGASPTPDEGSLTVQKLVRNISTSANQGSAAQVLAGETLEFTITMRNRGDADMRNVVLTDMVPSGMTYRAGSTTVNGARIAANTITSSGLALEDIPYGTTMTITWAADANRTSALPPGPNTADYAAIARTDDSEDVAAPVTVVVYGSTEDDNGSSSTAGTSTGAAGSTGGKGSGAGTVEAGPGDAVTLALACAAALALLYASYTRSDIYHRREVRQVTRKRDPMDFRS